MISLTRNLVAVLLGVCAAVISSTAYSQTTTQKKPAGTITGKVTIKGKAAPGVVVGLRSSEPGATLELLCKVTTDQDGKYRLVEIPAGNYQVTPLAPAFVTVGGSRGKPLVLGESESVDGIDFALVRGGVVTGKVMDADGRPVIEQRVGLFQAAPPPNQRGPLYPQNSVQTDDRGIYRMFGLAAGRYKVAVGQGGDGRYISPGSGRISYKQTFSPDTTDSAKATVVEVTEGSEAGNIDIVIGRASQSFAAAGRIINGENDQPLPNVRVGLQLVVGKGVTGFTGNTVVSNSGGEFKLENLAPGKYRLIIMPQPDSEMHADAVLFEVLDQDVNGLVVKTSKGASVAGTIVLENSDDKTILARLVQLQVVGYVQSEAAGGNFAHWSTINADGSFLLAGLESGTARLSLNSMQDRSLLKGFTVLRIEHGGVAQTQGLAIKRGAQVTGVRLIVSYGNAVVRGAVQLENGSLPAGVRIRVTYRKTGAPATSIRGVQLDTRNHFIVEGLPAGTYEFAAALVFPAPTRVRPIRATQQVTVADDGAAEVTLVLDLSAPADPVRP